jgi:hypothetical protein
MEEGGANKYRNRNNESKKGGKNKDVCGKKERKRRRADHGGEKKSICKRNYHGHGFSPHIAHLYLIREKKR